MPSACCAVLSSVDRDVWMPIMPSADVLDAKYARSSVERDVERDVWMPSMPSADVLDAKYAKSSVERDV